MTRYRLVLTRPVVTPRGPWRSTAREAREDALACGLGTRDEHVPGRIYLHALADVEQEPD